MKHLNAQELEDADISAHYQYIDSIKALPVDDGHARLKTGGQLREILYRMAARMERMSNAFGLTGNAKVATELSEWSEILEAIVPKLSEIEGTALSNALRDQQEMTGTILKTALAGALGHKGGK